LKKWILILVIGLFAVGLVGYLAGRGGFKSDEQKLEDTLLPKQQSIKSAPNLKYMPNPSAGGLQVEAQLNKDHWERIGAVSLLVKVRNNSGRALNSANFAITQISKSGSVVGFANGTIAGGQIYNLRPGETATLTLDMIIVSGTENIGRIEYSLKDVFFSNAVSPPPTQIPPPVANEGKLYYQAPSNPQTPEEVVAAFYFLLNNKKYIEAAKLLEGVEQAIKDGRVTEKQIVDEIPKFAPFGPGELQSIKVIESWQQDSYARVKIKLFSRGGQEIETGSMSLNKENGRWRLKSSNF
jgi:hypothetical protein